MGFRTVNVKKISEQGPIYDFIRRGPLILIFIYRISCSCDFSFHMDYALNTMTKENKATSIFTIQFEYSLLQKQNTIF